MPLYLFRRDPCYITPGSVCMCIGARTPTNRCSHPLGLTTVHLTRHPSSLLQYPVVVSNEHANISGRLLAGYFASRPRNAAAVGGRAHHNPAGYSSLFTVGVFPDARSAECTSVRTAAWVESTHFGRAVSPRSTRRRNKGVSREVLL